MRDLALFELFHTPPSTPRIDRYAVPPGDPKAQAQWLATIKRPSERNGFPGDRLDFHDIVGAMSNSSQRFFESSGW
jgi:hypothetical protein